MVLALATPLETKGRQSADWPEKEFAAYDRGILARDASNPTSNAAY